MILLEIFNNGVRETLLQRFQAAKSGSKIEKTKCVLADFDGVLYKLSNEEDRNVIKVSIMLKFYGELKQYDLDKLLKNIYGDYFCSTPDAGYSVTLKYDMTSLPDDIENLAHEASLLKRNCFAAVFEKFFEFQSQGQLKNQAIINYRDDETMFVRAMEDRVTVIFSTVFKDPDDVVIGKIFIQELTEARRRAGTAPQVLYSPKEPPSELKGTNAATGENLAYITFVLFTRHFETPEARKRTIDLIHTFRNYLHYHIKCSKAHIHIRMRAKSAEFLKVLQRAKPEKGVGNSRAQAVDFAGVIDLGIEGLNINAGDVKKTITGKTFRQM